MNRLFFISILIISNAFAAKGEFSVTTRWTMNFEKEVVMSCFDTGEYRCRHLCGNDSECVVKEEICKDCVGGDLFMTNFYRSVGDFVVNSGEDLGTSFFYDIHYFRNYITLKANSIYNVITEMDSKKMQAQFAKLCPDKTENEPVVFVEVDQTRRPVGYQFVVCDDKIYEITTTPQVYQNDLM